MPDREKTHSSPAEQIHQKYLLASVQHEPGLEFLIAQFNSLASVQSVQNKCGHFFNNRKLLFHCFSHSSYAHENQKWGIESNEKLEFLGDSILGLAITKKIFEEFKSLSEGEFSKIRGALVNTDVLSELAHFLGLDQCLLLGKGEIKSGGHSKASILADTFEAFIAAHYLDTNNMACCERMILKIYHDYSQYSGEELIDPQILKTFDAKSKFQEWTMKELKVLPEYIVKVGSELEEFEVELILKGKNFAKRKSYSKKMAIKELAAWGLAHQTEILEDCHDSK